ncbi:MAG: two-component system, NtrC family, sensor kinase, partial [Actinoplanes sp.]|nr:two-component system, NtrC family, sensor kinase [Actinoplanes sp.]
MGGRKVLFGHRFRIPDTMLGQIRALFLGFLIIWPIFGLWGVRSSPLPLGIGAVIATIALAGWLYAGYRRARFPAWSWIVEGGCVCVVAGASHYGTTIGLCFMWVTFRALYGSLREKLIAAATLAAIMTVGVTVFGARVGGSASLLVTALVSLAVNHVLARASDARDNSAVRERVAASAGAGFIASTTRQEAMDVTLGAALGMDRDVVAALIVTVAGPAVYVVAAAGDVSSDTRGAVSQLAALPDQARAALVPGGFELLTGDDATAVSTVLRLRSSPVVLLAPLAVNGMVFGMLVLAVGRHPNDELTAPVITLADEAALTLDQLLSRSRLRIVVDHSPDALILAAESGVIRFVNPGAEVLLDETSATLIGRDIWSFIHPDDLDEVMSPAATGPVARPCRIRARDSAPWMSVEAIVGRVSEHDGSRSIVFNARDVSERQSLELELRHAQKLESVGRLAAGIAHEINTPIQFVGDNTRFLESAFADLNRLHDAYR